MAAALFLARWEAHRARAARTWLHKHPGRGVVMETDLHDRDFARLWKAEDHAPWLCQAGQMRTAKLVDAWPGESVLTGAAAHALEFAFVAQEADPRFDKAAARWIGRLLVETPPLTLPETRWVLAMVAAPPLPEVAAPVRPA
jgi:hypothetical protein